MKKYLYDYIKEIDELLKTKKINEDIIHNHLIKIKFFQHERLIHLLVTLFYAFLFIVFLGLCAIHYIFFIVVFMLLVNGAKNNKKYTYDELSKEAVSAAKKYLSSNSSRKPDDKNTKSIIPLSTLVDENYMKDPSVLLKCASTIS